MASNENAEHCSQQCASSSLRSSMTIPPPPPLQITPEPSLTVVTTKLSKFKTIQINGRKVLGPPLDWNGPIPSDACELYIKKIPKFYPDHILINHFERFGKIYEFRLMMDFNECNRGYGYVKYTNEIDALRAKEVMNHFYIKPGKLLEVKQSYSKCRLFVGNIPKYLTKEEIEKDFRETFPKIKSISFKTRISDGVMNRGFVFMDFQTHEDALAVKKLTTPGRIKKWGRDLRIVWANQEKDNDHETKTNTKTLFVRNVDLSVNKKDLYAILYSIVDKSEVKKISKIREFAFIEFNTRLSAEKILNTLQNYELKGHKLNFEWALPPAENSAHTLKHSDYDAILRLKCIANYWNFPIIVFGRIFEAEHIQYAAVMLRNNHTTRIIFVELKTNNLVDVQSRLCEAVVSIINECGGLPLNNYVIKIIDDALHVVGHIKNLSSPTFIEATDINGNFNLYLDEIFYLCMAINALCKYNEKQIISMYNEKLRNNHDIFTYLTNIKLPNDRIFGCLNPLYRDKLPLKYNLNNTQIVLVLCYIHSLTNYIFPKFLLPLRHTLKNSYNTNNNLNNNNLDNLLQLKYTIIKLLPLSFVQSTFNQFKINKIYFGIKKNYILPKFVTEQSQKQ